VWAAFLAGAAFVLISDLVPPWLISSFHLPAVTGYVVVFSLTSMLMIGPFNRRILQGAKLPMADLLYTALLAPIALIVYYFFDTRDLSLTSLFVLVLPLIGVLITFRLYINIDTDYGEVNQLYHISQELLAAMSQEETVQKMAGSITQAMSELITDLDASLIYALNSESNEYLLVTRGEEQMGPHNVVPGYGLLGRIAVESVGRIVTDVSEHEPLTPQEREVWGTKTAILAYPLFADRSEVGLLVLIRFGRRFAAEEFRLVGIVANQVGATLHNAQMYERSLQRADRDRQLNVLNQAAFMERSERVMGRARGENQAVALLYPDIDDFRIVNNTYGHPTGDKVLGGVAELMKQVVKDRGLIGRSGGEEFFILLPNTAEQKAVQIADEIRQRIQDHVFFSEDGREVRATISTGVALFPRDAGNIANLIKQADRAAYLAKRMGKNRVCLYEDRREFIETAERETELGQASPAVQV
jgi:diguanylate cyclase (GGDEF)-like protein